jgi:hypothetical protein
MASVRLSTRAKRVQAKDYIKLVADDPFLYEVYQNLFDGIHPLNAEHLEAAAS